MSSNNNPYVQTNPIAQAPPQAQQSYGQQQPAAVPIFDAIDKAKTESGRYIKLVPGQKMALQFNVNKIEVVDTEWEGKKTGGKSVKYIVIDPANPSMEKELKLNVRKTDTINALLKKGIYFMELTKIGQGKEYQIIATPL